MKKKIYIYPRQQVADLDLSGVLLQGSKPEPVPDPINYPTQHEGFTKNTNPVQWD